MKKYYYSDGVNELGPFTFDELKAEGITKDNLVWFAPMNEWEPAGSIDELSSLFAEFDLSKPRALENEVHSSGETVEQGSPLTETIDFQSEKFSAQESKNKTGRIAVIILLAIVLVSAPLIYLNSSFFEEEVDLFRKMEGEKQVFVNKLTLRQYPDPKSSKIEVFPHGTRLIYEENESQKLDNEQRVWRKVRVIHPVYGWDRPDERFPHPYEGWMAVEKCGLPWVEDSLATANLLSILGNEDAGRSLNSVYRHGLVEFFQQKNYFGEWRIYGVDKKEKLQKIISTNLGRSKDDCNGDNQDDLVVIMQNNSGDTKLIVMSIDSLGKARVIYDEDAYETMDEPNVFYGMEKMSSSQLKALRKNISNNIPNAIVVQRGYDSNVLFFENDSLRIYYLD